MNFWQLEEERVNEAVHRVCRLIQRSGRFRRVRGENWPLLPGNPDFTATGANVWIKGNQCRIGGATPEARNVISGSGDSGLTRFRQFRD